MRNLTIKPTIDQLITQSEEHTAALKRRKLAEETPEHVQLEQLIDETCPDTSVVSCNIGKLCKDLVFRNKGYTTQTISSLKTTRRYISKVILAVESWAAARGYDV